MQIEDFSSLKEVSDDIEVPLNGVVYYAIPNPPADVVVAAASGGTDAQISAAVKAMAQGEDRLTPAEQADATVASRSSLQRAMHFLDQVLRPDSAALWAENMRQAYDDDGKPVDNPAAITLTQCVAVFRALLGVYSGRPTTPPSPSQNGRGGSGGRSTAGARAKE